MNQTHVLLSDLVSLSCSVAYRSQLNFKVTLTLTEASRTINVTSTSPAGGDRYTASATVRASKRQFGPFRCLAVFTQADKTLSSDELARNSVQLRSNVIQAVQPACTRSLCHGRIDVFGALGTTFAGAPSKVVINFW